MGDFRLERAEEPSPPLHVRLCRATGVTQATWWVRTDQMLASMGYKGATQPTGLPGPQMKCGVLVGS